MKKLLAYSIAVFGIVNVDSAFANNIHAKNVLTNSSTNKGAYYLACSDTGQAGAPVLQDQTKTEFTISTIIDSEINKTYHMKVIAFNGGPTICTFKYILKDNRYQEGGGVVPEIKNVDNNYPAITSTSTDYCSSVKATLQTGTSLNINIVLKSKAKTS
jgi:hypothetical protein